MSVSQQGIPIMQVGLRQKIVIAVYLLLLTLLASRPYTYSLFDMDMMGYIGNAVAMSGASIRQIHDTAYQAVEAEVPQAAKDHLLGRDKLGPPSQWQSRQDRASNAEHFAEYLPCFAIRPIFNQLIYVLHYGLGMGLVRATIVLAVGSYWMIGVLIFLWIYRYAGVERAALGSLLLMLSPPILELARFNTPDALACLVSLAALYLIFERGRMFWGITLLLISVYVRTDNAVLAVGALAYCSLVSRQLEKTKAAMLALLAAVSVLLINHFAGDYGLRMLYYRSFIAIPLAPGELVAKFGRADYVHAFRTAVSQTMNGSLPFFVFMGVVGICARRQRVGQAIATVTTFYLIVHFLLFPSGQERFWGVFYVGCAMVLMIGAWYREPMLLDDALRTRLRLSVDAERSPRVGR
ncbi:MAG: hypothetical protein JWQ87_2935 [Candidatus Sulfotelmatobacter sp.]|nr:hypothetical protein [Candidatus Sulfotelmatobacter sp.]